MADYDKYYKTKELFGQPYPELIDFFKNYEPKGKIIDLGCGQGRDSISLARLGYKVTGIDNSKVGIEQINSISKKERINAIGIVEDIYAFDRYQDFEIWFGPLLIGLFYRRLNIHKSFTLNLS